MSQPLLPRCGACLRIATSPWFVGSVSSRERRGLRLPEGGASLVVLTPSSPGLLGSSATPYPYPYP